MKLLFDSMTKWNSCCDFYAKNNQIPFLFLSFYYKYVGFSNKIIKKTIEKL